MLIQFNPTFFNMDADIDQVAELIQANDPNFKEPLRQAVYVAQAGFLLHMLQTLILKNVSKTSAKKFMGQIYGDKEGLLVENLKNLMALSLEEINQISFESPKKLAESLPPLLQFNLDGHYKQDFFNLFYCLILSALLRNDSSAIFLEVEHAVVKDFSNSLNLISYSNYHRQLMLSLLLPKASTCVAALIRTVEYFISSQSIDVLQWINQGTRTYEVLENVSPNLDIAKCGRADLVNERDFSWSCIHSAKSLNQLCLMKNRERLAHLLSTNPQKKRQSFDPAFVFQAAYTGDAEVFHLALQLFKKISGKKLPVLKSAQNYLHRAAQYSNSLLEVILSFETSDCFFPLAKVLTDYTTQYRLSLLPEVPEKCFIKTDYSDQADQFLKSLTPMSVSHPLEVNRLFLATRNLLLTNISGALPFFESREEATVRSLSSLRSPLRIQFPQDADYADLLATKEILEQSESKIILAKNLLDRFKAKNPALLKTLANLLWGEEICLDAIAARTALHPGINHFSPLLSLLFEWGFSASADRGILSRCAELKTGDYLWIRILIIALEKEKQIALIQNLSHVIIEKLSVDFYLSNPSLYHLIQEQRYTDRQTIPLEVEKHLLFFQNIHLQNVANILFFYDDPAFLPALIGAMSFYLNHSQKEKIEYIRQIVFAESNEDYLLPLLFQKEPGYSFNLPDYAAIPRDQNLILFLIKSILHQSPTQDRSADIASLFDVLLNINHIEALDRLNPNFYVLAGWQLKNNPLVMQALHDIFSLSYSQDSWVYPIFCVFRNQQSHNSVPSLQSLSDQNRPIQNSVEILLEESNHRNSLVLVGGVFDCVLPDSFYAKPKLPDFLRHSPYFITEDMFSDELIREFKKAFTRHFIHRVIDHITCESIDQNQRLAIFLDGEREYVTLEFLEAYEKIEMDKKSVNDFQAMEKTLKKYFFQILFEMDIGNYSSSNKMGNNYYLQVLLIFLLRPTEQEYLSLYLQILKLLCVAGREALLARGSLVFREPSDNDIRLFEHFFPVKYLSSSDCLMDKNRIFLKEEYHHIFFVACVLQDVILWKYCHEIGKFDLCTENIYIDFLKLVIASKSIAANDFLTLTIKNLGAFTIKNQEENRTLNFLMSYFFQNSAISFFIRNLLINYFISYSNHGNRFSLDKIPFISQEFRRFLNFRAKILKSHVPQISYPFVNTQRCLEKITQISAVLIAIENRQPIFLIPSIQDKFEVIIKVVKKMGSHLLPAADKEHIPNHLDFFWQTYWLLQEISAHYPLFFEFSRSIFKYIFGHDQYATTLGMLKLSIEQDKKEYVDQLMAANPGILEAILPHTQLSVKEYLVCQGPLPPLFSLEFSELGLSICFLRELNGKLLAKEIGRLSELEEILAKVILAANHVGVHTSAHYEAIIASDDPYLLPPNLVSKKNGRTRTIPGLGDNNFFSTGVLELKFKAIKPHETPLNRDTSKGSFFLKIKLAQEIIPETIFSSLHFAALYTRRAEPIICFGGGTIMMVLHETSSLSVTTPTRISRFVARENRALLSEKIETAGDTIFDAKIQTNIQKFILYIRAFSQKDQQKIVELLMQLKEVPGNEAILSIFYMMYNLLFHPLHYELKVQKSLSLKDTNLIYHSPINPPMTYDYSEKKLHEIVMTLPGPDQDAFFYQCICHGSFNDVRSLLAHGYDVRRSPRALWTAMVLGLIEYHTSDNRDLAYKKLNEMMQLLMFPADYAIENAGFPMGIGLNPDILSDGKFWSYNFHEGFLEHLQIAFILPEEIFINILPLMLKNAPNLYIHFTLAGDQEKTRLIEQYFYQGQKVPENTLRMLAIFQNIAENFKKGISLQNSFFDKCSVDDFLPFYTGLIKFLCKNKLLKEAGIIAFNVISMLSADNKKKDLLLNFNIVLSYMSSQISQSFLALFNLSNLDEKFLLVLFTIFEKKNFKLVEDNLIYNHFCNKIFSHYPMLLESFILKFFYQYFVFCKEKSLEHFKIMHKSLFNEIQDKNQKIKFSLLFIHCLIAENSCFSLEGQSQVQRYVQECILTEIGLSDYVSFMHSCDNIKYSNAFLYVVNFFSDFEVFLELEMVSQLETLPENSCFLGINETSFTLWSEFLDKLAKNNPVYFEQMKWILSPLLLEGAENNALTQLKTKFYSCDPNDLQPSATDLFGPELDSALTALADHSIFKRSGDSLSGPAHKPFSPAASSSSV